MIIHYGFRVPSEEGMFDTIYSKLMNEHSLVPAKIPPSEKPFPASFRIAVWEDETGLGRFRVHCFEKGKIKGLPGKTYDTFVFHYWESRLTRTIFEQDPIGPILKNILKEPKQIIPIPHLCLEDTIENMEK